GGGRFVRAIAWEQRVVAIGLGERAGEIGVAGNRPMPLRLGLPVDHNARMGGIRIILPSERLEQRGVQADQRTPFHMLELGVERARNSGRQVAIESARGANVTALADKRTSGEL